MEVRQQVCFFAKHFQVLGIEKYAMFLGRLGIGAELTVRPSGFVEPDEIDRGLTEAVSMC